jgi:hypothetical protein
MYLLPPHKRKHWLQNACSTIIYYVPCVWIELHMPHLDLNSSIQLNKIKWPWLPSFTFGSCSFVASHITTMLILHELLYFVLLFFS